MAFDYFVMANYSFNEVWKMNKLQQLKERIEKEMEMLAKTRNDASRQLSWDSIQKEYDNRLFELKVFNETLDAVIKEIDDYIIGCKACEDFIKELKKKIESARDNSPQPLTNGLADEPVDTNIQSPLTRSNCVQSMGEGQSIDESLGKHGQGTHKPSLTSPVDTNICKCGHCHLVMGIPSKFCRDCSCEKFEPQEKSSLSVVRTDGGSSVPTDNSQAQSYNQEKKQGCGGKRNGNL